MKDAKRSPNFQHSRPSIFARDCLLFLTLKSSELEKNHEIQICRESNLLSNPTGLTLIRILSQTLWLKYRIWLKTPFLSNFLKKVWSEDFFAHGLHTFLTCLPHEWAGPMSNHPPLSILTLEFPWMIDLHLIGLGGGDLHHLLASSPFVGFANGL